MKKIISAFAFVFVSSLLISCVTTKLVSLEEEGLLSKQPIRISDESNKDGLAVRAQISKSDRKSLSFSNEIPENDSTSFSHFSWDIPQYQFNGELEFSLNGKVAFISGLSFAKIHGKEFLGTHFGAAFISINETNTIRFDIGAKFQKLNYNLVYSRVWESYLSKNKPQVISTSASGNYRNIYLGFTVSGNKKDVFANYFLAYTLTYQTFFDFAGNTTAPAYDLTNAFHSLSFGLFKNINNVGRIIAGIRITNFQFDFGEITPFDFYLQYDFFLF